MHDADLILTLTGAFAFALVLGYFTHRIGLSPIVGYLLAGIAVGPSTPGFVANHELAEQLAEVGVILLMFGVGLKFHFKELLEVRQVAVPGALGRILVATLLGILVAFGFGWGLSAGFVFGLAISVASTVVLLRILADHNELHTQIGHITVGWVVVEDLFTVLVLVLLPVFFGSSSADAGSIALAVAFAVVKIGVLVAFTIVIGRRFLPWFLGRVASTRSRELFTLAILIVALGIAVGSAKLFGVSMALGAFLAGMVVGRSDFSSRAASEALPMSDVFAVLFFVSVGMLFNPMFLIRSPGLVAATLAIVLVGRPLAAMAIVLLLRYPVRVALSVAIALAQIGEFSFILAAMGSKLEILPEVATNAIIAAAIVSISLNPILYRMVDPLERFAKRRPKLWRWLNSRLPDRNSSTTVPHIDNENASQTRAIVVGYGPVGRTLVRLLLENSITPIIVEMNFKTVRSLRKDGLLAIHGDATHREIIKSAGADRASVFILTSSGMRGSDEAIRQAREVNPKIRVFARATALHELNAMRQAGADMVFAAEGEMALTMTEYLLLQLGATPEQIDREKDRIRTELFGCSKGPEKLWPVSDPESIGSPSKPIDELSIAGKIVAESRKPDNGAGTNEVLEVAIEDADGADESGENQNDSVASQSGQ